MTSSTAYLLAGACLLLAVVLPTLTRRFPVSPPLVLLLTGAAIGATPLAESVAVDVVEQTDLVWHVTELTVLIALMGVGLAIDRPLRRTSWRGWSPTWRLLAITMPLSILGVALLGGVLGLAPAAALLLGAALAPTDPVLASDVQVGGPGSAMVDTSPDECDPDDPTVVSEEGEVRFALTSEAGLNDGLAFPFVHGALLLAAGGSGLADLGGWLAWDLVGRVVIGVLAGVVVGRLLGRLAFRSRRETLRMAEQGEPLLAIAGLVTAYGVAEVLHGYGFLAVFVCGLTLRAADRAHDYHRGMHAVIERLERLFTLAVLIFLGVGLTSGLLGALDWRGVAIGLLLVLVLRPLAGWVSMGVGARRTGLPGGTTPRGRRTIAFFGVRGVGSIFYLAYAATHGFGDHPQLPWLWSTVAFTVALSVVVHGIASTPVIRRLESEAFEDVG